MIWRDITLEGELLVVVVVVMVRLFVACSSAA